MKFYVFIFQLPQASDIICLKWDAITRAELQSMMKKSHILYQFSNV